MNKFKNSQFINKITFGLIVVVFSFIIGFLVYYNFIFGLAVVLSLLLAILMATNFRLGLILVILSVICGQLVRIPVPGEEYGVILLSDVMVIFLIFFWAISHLSELLRQDKNKFLLPASPINWLILIFFVIALISLLTASGHLFFNELLTSSFYLVRLVSYVSLYFVILDLGREREEINYYLSWLIGLGVIVAILGFIQLIFFPDFTFMWIKYGWDPHYMRLLATFFDPNYVGGFLTIILSLTISMYFFIRSPRKKIILIALGAILFLALILTYSRSSLLAFLIAFLIIGIFKSRKLLLLGAILVILIPLIFPRIKDRLEESFSGIDKSVQGRLESWQNTWRVIEDHPIIGVGYNTYAYTMAEYGLARGVIPETGVTPQALGGSDSSLLTIWVTTGTIGLVIYLAIYLTILGQSFKSFLNKRFSPSLRGFSLGLFAAIIAILIHSQFVNSLLYPFIMVLIWILFGLFVAWRNIENEKLNPSTTLRIDGERSRTIKMKNTE